MRILLHSRSSELLVRLHVSRRLPSPFLRHHAGAPTRAATGPFLLVAVAHLDLSLMIMMELLIPIVT